MEPIRRAVLIGSQTPGSTHLPGVKEDLASLKEYLLSPNGGGWHNSEIIILENPTVNIVLATIRQAIADYVYVYFSGHGITRRDNARMIVLMDGELQDLQLLNESPRQTIMIDACGTLEERAAIGGIGRRVWPEEKRHYFDGYSAARAYFNNCISESPYGKLIVHATKIGQSAIDTPNGGKFTNALLDSVYAYQQSQQTGILSVNLVVDHARNILRGSGLKQNPVIYKQGYLNVPFGIINTEFITLPEQEKVVNSPRQTSSGNGVAVLVLATILIAAIAAGK
jgi:hypothetical protein